jgi:PhzF family phenazine biosynthesis protein
VQECSAGLVPIRRGDAGLAFAAPDLLRSGPVDAGFVGKVADVLGISRDDIVDAAWVDNGPGWVGVLLRDAAAVLAVEPEVARHAGEGNLDIGLVGPYPNGASPPDGPEGLSPAIEVRALFSDERGMLREDPVTGSLNASLAQWLLTTGRLTAPYVASQGTRLGRTGRPRIEQDEDGTVWVGGATTTIVEGEIVLPAQPP